MFRMQIYLPEELVTSLKAKAAVEDISMSELIRQGLRKILKIDESKADPFKIFVGQYKAKVKTNAVAEINKLYQ